MCRNLFLIIPIILISVVLLNGFPPLYHDIRNFEQKFPQHNPSLAESGRAKYLAFPDHIWGHGWNNVLQEYLMHSWLAYITNRSFVFDDYIWSRTTLPYTIYDLAFRTTHIPLNAFISGPTAGGPFIAPSESFPRAVHSDFWETVCPREKRHVVSSADIPDSVWGLSRVQWWRDKIAEKEDVVCLEVEMQQPIFDFSFFGGPELLDVWPSLSKTPILTRLRWSPLVSSAIERNFITLSDPHERFYDNKPEQDVIDSQHTSTNEAVVSTATYHSLVAVHIRRGDFHQHCPRLANWGSPFHGFNSFEGLPDPWTPFVGSSQSEATEYYRKRCLPTQDEIVERLHVIRKEYDVFLSNRTSGTTRSGHGYTVPTHQLRRVFVLSNAWFLWLDGLRGKLVKDGWDDVIVSGDLILDKQQRGVSVAVDMGIAERAEVFVGNGFSSLSGNIVMLRTAKGLHAQTNRLF